MEITNFITGFESLPEKIQKQVLDYVEFLRLKYSFKSKKEKKIQFDWEGGLSSLKNNYTSVDLQHEANQLR